MNRLKTNDLDAQLILLVEDDEDLGAVLEDVVVSRGYRVLRCTTCREARGALSRLPIAAILDWGLPDGDPGELANAFLAQGTFVILTSGAEQVPELAARIGAHAVLEKPYNLETLFATLERLLGPPPDSSIES